MVIRFKRTPKIFLKFSFVKEQIFIRNKQNDILGKENINESLSTHYLIYGIDNL